MGAQSALSMLVCGIADATPNEGEVLKRPMKLLKRISQNT